MSDAIHTEYEMDPSVDRAVASMTGYSIEHAMMLSRVQEEGVLRSMRARGIGKAIQARDTDRWRIDMLLAVVRGKPLDDNARQMFDWVIEMEPANVVAWNGLGRCAMERKEYARAAFCFNTAYQHDPKDHRSLLNAAVCYDHLRDFKQAHDCANAVLAIKPDCAEAYVELVSIADQCEDAAFDSIIEQGLAVAPGDARLLFARGMQRLKHGDFAGGWADYEHRPSRLEMLEQCDETAEWKGEPLEGKRLLILAEQGIGDQIMFARYVEDLFQIRDERFAAWLHTKPELARFFGERTSAKVVTSDAEIAGIDFDYWIGMASLPHVLGRGIVSTGPMRAYRSNAMAHYVPKTGRLRVGLAWKGNPKHSRDAYRSMTWEQIKTLADIPNCDFYSLQWCDRESGLTCLLDYCHDWADKAAMVANLDLVISVDTAVAHLAGSIGTPCWLLLSKLNDWRWGTGGGSTPWYQSVRKFQQPSIDDWDTVLSSLALAPIDRSYQYSCEKPSIPLHQHRNNWPKADPTIIATKGYRYGPMSYYRNDHYIGRALELYGEYSESEAGLLRDILKSGDAVVDAGANIGGLTVAIQNAVGQTGLVLAYEPQPRYYDLLARNCFAFSGITTIPQALGSEVTTITMRHVEIEKLHAPGWESTGEEFTVQQNTIDNACFNRLALIKVDVDGMELAILKGAESTIARCRPYIYVENDKPERYPDLLPWLAERGYRLYQHFAPLYNPNNFAGYHVNVFGGIVSAMVLAVPNEKFLPQQLIDEHGLQRIRAKHRTG